MNLSIKIFTISLCLLVSASLSSQTITGIITDNESNPIPGVNVTEKGTDNATTTNVVGEYSIEVSSPASVLVFNFIGYVEQEYAVEDKKVMDIKFLEGLTLGEVKVVGSRNYSRTSGDSPVAIDLIDMAKITNQNGKVEINQILQYAAPSFNATKQSGSDGADHIDPASLRGLGPDQTLVLVNGKRRHQSSLVNVFGTRGRGNSGTDLNAIPASAIKRVEILRDGSAAQYGSDAIAGVINIVLHDQTDGLQGGITYGAHSTAIGGDYAQEIFNTQDGWEPELSNIEGKNRLDGEDKSWDGNTMKVDLNYGTKLGDNGGFVNFTTEYITKDRTLRPGFDFRKGYGSAAVDQFQFMVNGAFPLTNNTELYVFGGSGNRNTDAYAFSRSAPGADGDERTVPSLYPNGFTPHITSVIGDNSMTAGVRNSVANGWTTDLNHTFGANDFHYYITGTNNASLGSASPTNFDAGGHSLSMNVTSLDFSKNIADIASGLNIAFGTEFRSENFVIFSGEEASYSTYDTNGVAITNAAMQVPFVNEFGQQAPGSSQGFPGYSPSNEVDRNRSNIGFFGDAELSLSKKLLFAAALRYENYSDFGNTFNYKLASRYKINNSLTLRASASTGFRAPSLAQVHYNLLFNNIVGGNSLRTLLASNTSTVARAFGIEQLQEEKAQNFAGGIGYKNGGLSISVDGYMISVEDRIILTDVFDVSALNVGAEAAQFFANGVDTRTTGVDVIVNYNTALNGTSTLNLGVAANFNNTEIESINNGELDIYTFFGPFSQAYLEAAAPDYKIGFNASFKTGKFESFIAWTQFSEVQLQDFQWIDAPPTNEEESNNLLARATDTYESMGVLDLSLAYNISENLKFSIGANNLLNVYPTQQFDGWTDQGGFNDSVQMGSDGMYLFGRIGFKL